MAASLENIFKAIYARAEDQLSCDISPRWRRQGEQLPHVTYDMVSAEWIGHLAAASNCCDITVAFTCTAETLEEALQLADEVRVAFYGKFTEDGVTMGSRSVTIRNADPIPDDGTGDTERMVIVTIALFAQDEN